MLDIRLIVNRPAPDRLVVRGAAGGQLAEAPHRLDDLEAIDDLLAQARSGAPAAARALGELLGALIFAEAPGSLVRERFAVEPEMLLGLETDESLATWPWELAIDPATGRCPVADGLSLVRLGGPLAGPSRMPPRGLLVVPAICGAARLDAVRAATRALVRKAGLDVFPADPATGPALRRQLSHGTALLHLEGVGTDGRVALDDGRVPYDRLGVDGSTWLAVIGGADAAPEAAAALRQQAVQVVIGRQLDLEAHGAAVVDREIYRALAGGADPLSAVGRARQALLRSSGLEGFAWGALVLWSAGALPGEVIPAAMPFPPRAQLAEASRDVAEVSVEMIVEMAPPVVGTAAPPVPAPVFVRDTVRLLKAGADRAEHELDARLATLRALGGGLDFDETPPDDLPTEQRTGWLADRLVDSIGRPDLPLMRPSDESMRAGVIAGQVGVDERSVSQLAAALAASRVVWVRGDGARALAEGVANSMFGFHAAHVRGGPTVPLLGAPNGPAPHAGDGWLYRSVALNWRRDELDPRRPAGPPPSTRMRLVARTPGRDGWQVHTGTWLVLSAAEATEPGQRGRLLAALADGALEGFDAEGHAYRLAIPADYRVMLVGTPPADLPVWVPIVSAGRASSPVRQARWLAQVERSLGPAGDGAEAERRAQTAAALDQVLSFVASVAALPLDALGEAALAFAIERAGDEAVDEALCVFVAPRLNHLAAEVVLHFLLGYRDEMLQLAEGAGLLRALTLYLDQQDPTLPSRMIQWSAPTRDVLADEEGLAPPELRLPLFVDALSNR